MESFPTYPRQHRGHDGNAPAGRRGAFRNKTWIAGDRSGSSTPFPAGHLGVDAPRWERGATRGFVRGRGRGKGRSPRPDLDPSQHHPTEDVSEPEQEDNADAGAANGAEAAAAVDEPVLETLEERERFYQEVGPFRTHTSLAQFSGKQNRSFFLRARSCALRAPFCFALARESPRGGEKEGDRGGEDG